MLIIDDEPKICWTFEQNFKMEGWKVDTANCGRDGLNLLTNKAYKVVFLDLMMPDCDGLEVLQKINDLNLKPIVIIITGHASYDTAVQAIKLGAHDYIRKPLSFSEIRATLTKALAHDKLVRENIELRRKLSERRSFEGIIGKSPKLRKVFRLIERCAASDINVLIQGPSGTGKELVAKAIHNQSKRKKFPFVVVDCASIPENLLQAELFGYAAGAFTGAKGSHKGFLEEANKGTLFLDEIGEMPLSLQSNLLRFVQDREFYRVGSTKKVKVDVRILAATNRDLMREVDTGSFRLDLYNRLNTITISLPTLKERPEDIPDLADYFITKYYEGTHDELPKISPEAYDALEAYKWPGNIRELENSIRRALVLTDNSVISSSLFQFNKSKLSAPDTAESSNNEKKLPFKDAKKDVIDIFEKRYIIALLKHTSGNIKRVAEQSGLSRPAVHKLIRKHNIAMDKYR